MSATITTPERQQTSIQGRHLINGQWQSGEGQIESINPAKLSDTVGVVPVASAETVDEAVRAAREAFGPWRDSSWVRRAEYVDNLAQLIKRDLEDLSVLVTRECGKPYNEGRADVVEALHMAQFAAGMGREPVGLRVSSEIPEKDAFILRKPKGVVGIITPWNFPVAIPLWGILPSVVAGNTVVFKPSEETPICGHRLAELFEEAGFPNGVINVVHGDGETTGDAIVRHEDVNVILFTGSRAVGTHIQKAVAGEFHKFVATEMGGKNAVIVLEDADMDIALNACLLSGFKTTGQRCVSAGRLIVDRKIEGKFTERYLELVGRIQVGDGLDKDTFMGPLINQDGVEKWKHHNEKAIEEGGEVLIHGKEISDRNGRNGFYVEPFVYRFEQYKPDTFCLKEEAFSPHVAIIGVDGLEEAVRVYNDTKYGLSMAVITEDYRKWRWVRDHAAYGLGYVNLPSIGAEVHLPFGGVKGSGNGHPAAEGLMESVTHRVAFTINHGQEIEMAQGLSTEL